MEHAVSDQLLFRYLLDQVSDEERTRVEERFLADDDYYRQLLIVEDELRCACASGSLGPEERQRFEDRFLIFDDEREKVADARSMIAELAAMPLVQRETSGSRRSLIARLALAAAAVLAIGVASWQAFEGYRLRSQLAALEAQRDAREQQVAQQTREDRARQEQLDRELQEERRTRAVLEQELARQRDPSTANRAAPGPVLSLFLTPGRVRAGGETKTITIAQDAAEVRLVLALEGQRSYRTYEVEIINSEGARVWARAGVAAGEQVVIVGVPARVLTEDDYELALKGVSANGQTERAGNYYFTALK